jgi:hypothetical protein
VDPYIAVQPTSVSAAVGTPFTLSVTAHGDAITYAWRKFGTPIAGATNSTYGKVSASTADNGSYSVVIAGTYGSVTSSIVSVTVENAIVITKQPISLSKYPGQAATFTIKAGTNAVYQWRKDGVNIPIGPGITNFPGGSSYSIYPITTNFAGGYDVVLMNSFYSVTSSLATLTVLSDTNVPKVVVTVPKAGVGYTDPQVSAYTLAVNGTASDIGRVEQVRFSINSTNAYTSATLNTNDAVVTWSGSISVVPGTNVFRIYAVDFSGLTSAVQTVTFFYNVSSPLTLNIVTTPSTSNNVGSVINPAGTNLLVGRPYKLTAVPDALATYIFTNWTDGNDTVLQPHLALSYKSNLVLNFIMSSNLVINANFVTNLFQQAKGEYNGLFYETNGIKHHSGGYITLKVSPKFGVSGKVKTDGNVVGFGGKFTIDGQFTGTAKRAKLDKSDLTVNLQINFGAGTVTGSISDAVAGWNSPLTADQYLWNLTNNPALDYVNNYTLVLPPFDDNTNGPAGYSAGTLTVLTNGKVKFTAGLTADGQKWTHPTTLSQSGVWPMWAPLYVQKRIGLLTAKEIKENKGEIMGWLTFQTNTPAGSANLAPLGTVDWINTGGTNTYWTAGHTNQVAVLASRWRGVAPLLNWTTNGVADVSGANLGSNAFSANLTLTTNKLIATVPLTNNFKIGLTLGKGLIKGSLSNSVSGTINVPWTGVLLQDHNYGRGSFLSPTGAGKVEVHEAP